MTLIVNNFLNIFCFWLEKFSQVSFPHKKIKMSHFFLYEMSVILYCAFRSSMATCKIAIKGISPDVILVEPPYFYIVNELSSYCAPIAQWRDILSEAKLKESESECSICIVLFFNRCHLKLLNMIFLKFYLKSTKQLL